MMSKIVNMVGKGKNAGKLWFSSTSIYILVYSILQYRQKSCDSDTNTSSKPKFKISLHFFLIYVNPSLPKGVQREDGDQKSLEFICFAIWLC